MGKIGVGVIGLGFMGSTHFRIYQAMENAHVVALADVAHLYVPLIVS